MNDEVEAAIPRGGAIHPSGRDVCVGAYSAGHPRAFFDGILEEVKTHHGALAEQEIKQHYRDHAGDARK